MSAQRKRKRPGANRSALKSAAAKRSNALKLTAASAPRARALSLPGALEERLVDLEARLDRLEAVPCVMACRGEACPTACPTEVPR
jgi:hypothetical protein